MDVLHYATSLHCLCVKIIILSGSCKGLVSRLLTETFPESPKSVKSVYSVFGFSSLNLILKRFSSGYQLVPSKMNFPISEVLPTWLPAHGQMS